MAFLQMLGVFAEFEINLRKERQIVGIAKVKNKGVYKGRKPSLTTEQCKVIRIKKANGTPPHTHTTAQRIWSQSGHHL
jgi:DNA invertase Pin-like site-specific DNA recombinase